MAGVYRKVEIYVIGGAQSAGMRTVALDPARAARLERYRLGDIISYQGTPYVTVNTTASEPAMAGRALALAIIPLGKMTDFRWQMLRQGIARPMHVVESVDALLPK